MSDYKFKVGDKVNFIGDVKTHYCMGQDLQTDIDKYNNVFTIGYVSKDYIEFEENSCWCINANEIKLYTRFNGIILLEEIKKGKIKNCDIKVYKNNIYQFTIQCGEKAILDNPKHHIGMLTSDKYTYEPVYKKEMTIAEIEEELGYPIKIVKE